MKGARGDRPTQQSKSVYIEMMEEGKGAACMLNSICEEGVPPGGM